MIFIRRAAWCLFNSLAALIILISPVLAVCPPAPIPNADDLVLRFPSAQGVWTGSSSLMAGNVANTFINVEGVVIYDASDKTLKLCDGTSWQPLSGTTSSSAAAGSIGQIQFNDGSGNLAASSNLLWKNSERRLGIGTNDPNAVLHLNGDITASNPHILLTNNAGGAYSFLATRSGIALKGTTEGTGYNDYYFNLSNTADNEYTGHLHGIIATVAAQGTSSPAVINGLVGRPYLQNAATVPTTVGVSGQLYAHGAAATGHVTQAIALEASSIYRGGGSTATFGTTYGLLIRPRLYGDTRYGVYQSAADDTNVFMGKMGIGTTTPASQLHVSGGITLGNDTDTCPGAANAKLGTMRFSGGAFSACLAGGWSALATSTASAAGSKGEIQFNDGSGNLAASPDLLWDNTTSTLTTDKLHVGTLRAIGNNSLGYSHALRTGTTAMDSHAWMEMWAEHPSRQGEFVIAGRYVVIRSGSTETEAGVPRLYVAESGNVGIGNITPTSLLTIGDGTKGEVTDTTSLEIQSRGFASLRLMGDYDDVSGESGGAYVFFGIDGPIGGAEGLGSGFISAVQKAGEDGMGADYEGTLPNSLLIGTKTPSPGNRPLHLGAGNAVQVTVIPSGNVGVGTNTPTEKLEVDGNIRVTPGHGIQMDVIRTVADFSGSTITITPSGTGVVCAHEGGTPPNYSYCDCPTGYLPISGGGHVGLTGRLRETRHNGTKRWIVACTDNSNTRMMCASITLTCMRIIPN